MFTMKSKLEPKRVFDYSLCPHSLVVVVVVKELHVEQAVHLVAASQDSDEDRQGREGDTQNIHRSYIPCATRAGQEELFCTFN